MTKIGIGFITGRRSFRNAARTYANNWYEHNLVQDQKVSLNLFVVYDLRYTQTRVSDYTQMDESVYEMIDNITFLGKPAIRKEALELVEKGVVSRREARLVFGDGYAKRRNIITYLALKSGIDYLIFLDDDEYPVAAVLDDEGNLSWRGQGVVTTHLRYIPEADLTHGHHCGYISPIPYLEFNDVLTEDDFRLFVEAISNDIISWASIKEKMARGGVSLADPQILANHVAYEVPEVAGAKFISGSNLCLNLHSMGKLAPFYNPPEARGEDTFLSTCLTGAKVLKVPCYTFHDGFSTYNHLLHGVLPRRLRPVKGDSQRVASRFLRAAIGWTRYKPLFTHITRPGEYERIIDGMRRDLARVIPKLCRYFDMPAFARILDDLDYYAKNVHLHQEEFEAAKLAWSKIVNYTAENRTTPA